MKGRGIGTARGRATIMRGMSWRPFVVDYTDYLFQRTARLSSFIFILMY